MTQRRRRSSGWGWGALCACYGVAGCGEGEGGASIGAYLRQLDRGGMGGYCRRATACGRVKRRSSRWAGTGSFPVPAHLLLLRFTREVRGGVKGGRWRVAASHRMRREFAAQRLAGREHEDECEDGRSRCGRSVRACRPLLAGVQLRSSHGPGLTTPGCAFRAIEPPSRLLHAVQTFLTSRGCSTHRPFFPCLDSCPTRRRPPWPPSCWRSYTSSWSTCRWVGK